MSDDASARLALDYILSGQAQKELRHNEALTRLDFLLQPAVSAVGVNTPPNTPAAGQCWIVGDPPTELGPNLPERSHDGRAAAGVSHPDRGEGRLEYPDGQCAHFT